MPYVMQFETWKNLTEVSFKPRSKYLKRVDNALLQYHKTKSLQDLSKLKIALHHWKMSKGYESIGGRPRWMTTDRNSRKAVETLDKQIFGLPEAVNTEVLNDLAELPFFGIEAWADDLKARQAMKDAREYSLFEMFRGKQVVVKKLSMLWMADKIKRGIANTKEDAAKIVKTGASVATQSLRAEARKMAVTLIEEVLGDYPIEVAKEISQEIMQLIPELLTELVDALVPYVSLVRSSTLTAKNAALSIRAEYQWVVSADHMGSFAKGDPYAAVEAVRRMIERKRNQYMRLTGIYGADTAVRAGAIIVDAAAHGAPVGSMIMGQLASFGKTVALLALRIFLLGRDLYEKYHVNKVLASATPHTLSKAIFDTCPLLGCYYVAGANTSDIINFAVQDVGATGWKLDVEVMMKKHIEPMIGYAREAVNDARLEVKGLERSKAAVNDTSAGFLNSKNRLQKTMISRLSAVLPFIDDPNDYQQAARRDGFTAVSPAVLKERTRRI